ncbi:MAG: M15 family metallopeptidase [Candidatus Brocadiales bacterium]|nr:M15 family metallopeptidase [Candidatus Bathyanammoxibius sp.]
MPRFGDTSKTRLATCDDRLQRLLNEVILRYDVRILQGYRSQQEQETAYRERMSKLRWPKSKHNQHPSLAVDVAPYPIDWEDRERFFYMGGLIKGVAAMMGIRVRWGGDWDSDTDFKDQRFTDLPHFEILI